MTDHIGEATQKVIDLDALEKLADEATPGPWTYRGPPENGYSTFVGRFETDAGAIICDFGDSETYYPSEGEPPEPYDAAFIAAANPATIKALIAELKEARGLLERADQFMTNGIGLGYIRMPDADCPDPAHDTPIMIRAFLARNGKGEG